MHKAKLKFLILQLVVIFLTGLIIWKVIIEPKNARLTLHEILVETKASKASDFKDKQLTSIWLSSLNQLNPNHLRPCEKIQYHNLKAMIERREEQTDTAQTSLQKKSRLYSTDMLTLEQLSQIGEAEFEKVLSELNLFETEYRNAGGTYSLNELAQQPKNFRSNAEEVADIYKVLIAKAEESLTSRFYDYDIPKGTVEVVRETQRYSALGSYHPRRNSFKAYFDEASYDISIAAHISVHEIFPGHHLDWKSSSSERICRGYNSSLANRWHSEGWATYAEFIAEEEGFFSAPEHKLAWLDYRLTRAMRIILDVKRMHPETKYDDIKRVWMARMPERLHPRFDPELNRLVKSNHQHLSYILGYQAIMRTKKKLMQDLGDEFDELAFHDAMLRLNNGYPETLYVTTKIVMETPDLRANYLSGP